MALIDFYIRNQKLSKTGPRIVSDSVKYVDCSFAFKTGDWDGMDKWVTFKKGDKVYRVDLINDAIPKETGLNLGAGIWHVSLFGENGESRITTNSVTLEVAQSAVDDGEPLPEISLTEAEQISAKAQEAINIAEDVERRANSGEFDGKDYVLTDADKEEIAGMVQGGGSAKVTAESIEEALGYPPAKPSDIPKNAADIGALPFQELGAHNTDPGSHNDIRILLLEIKTAVENFLDIDDTKFDQLSELVALIEANADSIEKVTNGKVNVADIVNNLTTNSSNKPLSAAQGVVLKELVDALDTVANNATTTAESASATANEAWELAKTANTNANVAKATAMAAGKQVNSLEERMNSGEFKGEVGPQGPEGPQGPTGPAYSLTAEDKSSIAAAVKSSLTTENWTFELTDGTSVTKAVLLG